jgi:hypothetical protein
MRPEIDKAGIVVRGVSFAGSCSAKLAITEDTRIKAASAQSLVVHEAFQPTSWRRSCSAIASTCLIMRRR